ncbi:MAG TPA: LytR C-terminal domain-containing protein [Gemmatimonadaceae bacterium]
MSPNRRKKIGRWIVVGGIVLVASGSLARLYLRSGPRLRSSAPVPGHIVPSGAHVRVEVLNATDTKGLARRAMLVLRSAGFDVVFFGNTTERADTTRVLDRSGHADWAALAARAMGRSRVEEIPDSSRFLDVTVLVGRNWTPPLEPLYP